MKSLKKKNMKRLQKETQCAKGENLKRLYRIHYQCQHHDVNNDRVNHKHSSHSLLILMLDFHFSILKIAYS